MPPDQPYRIAQICVVVEDLDKALKTYHELLGWAPWHIYDYEPPLVHSRHLHGKEEAFTMIGAECEVQPGLWFELIQPLEGPSIYKEHLEKHGEGLHHLAISMPSVEASEAFQKKYRGMGCEVSMGAKMADQVDFCYVDATPLKFVVELVWDAGQQLMATRQYPPVE